MTASEIQKRLFEMRDENYKEFQSKLIPTVEKERVIGVRIPELRKFAKELANGECEEFLSSLPHFYYDENNLHGFIIAECKDYSKTVMLLNVFLPFIDNWATCDLLKPKAFEKHRTELKEYISELMQSRETYTLRFAMSMMMTHFLDDDFCPAFLDNAADLKSNEYYINMMRAWFFATALSKQWESAIPFITEQKLDRWTHNKTICKCTESYRITPEQKEYLKTLKIK